VAIKVFTTKSSSTKIKNYKTNLRSKKEKEKEREREAV